MYNSYRGESKWKKQSIKDMPQVGMGTLFSRDPEVINKIIKVGLEAGYKHIDTAQFYRNEHTVGKAIKESGVDREQLFITTKIHAYNYKKHTRVSLKESLRRLQLNRLNLVLLHWPYNHKNEYIAYKELIKAREEGLIDNIGVSNFSIENLKELHQVTGEWPYCNQILLSPTYRAIELEEFCKSKGIKLTGFSIVRSYVSSFKIPGCKKMSEEQKQSVRKIAKAQNKDAGQVLNKWAIQNGYHVLPTSQKPKRTISNLQLNDFELSLDEIKVLDAMNSFTSGKYYKIMNGWIRILKATRMFRRGYQNGKN